MDSHKLTLETSNMENYSNTSNLLDPFAIMRSNLNEIENISLIQANPFTTAAIAKNEDLKQFLFDDENLTVESTEISSIVMALNETVSNASTVDTGSEEILDILKRQPKSTRNQNTISLKGANLNSKFHAKKISMCGRVVCGDFNNYNKESIASAPLRVSHPVLKNTNFSQFDNIFKTATKQ